MNIPERAFDPAGRLSVMITSGRPSARSAASAMLLVLCAGCAAQPAPPPSSVSTPVRTHVSTFARTPSTAPTTQPATAPGPARPGTPRVLATGLDVPWDFAVLPDGSTLITLRDRAEVVRVTRGGDRQVVGRIDEARPKGEGGLLGLTLSPRFSTDGLVYVYYSAQQDNRVVRYRYAGNRLSAPRVVLAGIPRSSNHNGGRLRFGPDGMLYITTGDVTAKPPSNAQDVRSLAGKILRVTATGGIPRGNPFGNEVWSYGHRNVQGIGWDSEGRMFASEFGSNRLDELNLVVKGGNFGWPQTEGPSGGDKDLIDPLLSWNTTQASPSGIAVTSKGTVFLAALRGQRLWRSSWTGSRMTEPDVYFDGVGRLRAVEVVGDELWLLTNNTARGKPHADDDKLIAINAP